MFSEFELVEPVEFGPWWSHFSVCFDVLKMRIFKYISPFLSILSKQVHLHFTCHAEFGE